MNGEPGFIMDAIRSIFSAIDWVFYSALGWVYEIFINISSVKIFSSETIIAFFGRVQLILGVFMVFKLTVSILQFIVNPDKMYDKSHGNVFVEIISRVVTCLIMLTLLIPLNIPAPVTEFDKQISSNGILFGSLYSLQDRILNNNTLGKLILGTGPTGTTITSGNTSAEQAENLKSIGDEFVGTIAKCFIIINDDCSDKSEIINKYNSMGFQELSDNINTTCNNDKNYTYNYYPLIGTVVAAVFIFVLVGFSIDIAVRAIKIAVLRLIAPIPVISYMDPNQAQKGAFANWVKVLISTYLDLFIRLAIIYFVLFLAADIFQNGLDFNTNATGLSEALITVVVLLGLFFFAKQAPKFIKDVLGVKGGMQNIGLASLLGGTAAAVYGGGLAGLGYGAINGAKAEMDAAAQGKQLPTFAAWNSNRDLMTKIRTGDKDAQGGLMGKLQDRFNYGTRENNAARLGMSAKDVAIAKYEQDQWEAEAARTQKALDYAKQRLSTMSKPSENATQAEKDAYNNAYTEYQRAYEANEDAKARYGKATSAYEKMDKARGQMGLGPTIEATRRENYRTPYKVTKATREDVLDKNGQPVKGSDGNVQTEIKYEFGKDTKSFSGTLDDSVFSGSEGTGSPGSHGGPPHHH